MTSGSLPSNAVDLRECSSNVFTLAEINGLKWCKYTGAPRTLDRPLDDPVLVSFANALESNVLCSWRHSPSFATQRLNEGLTCSESAKELWLFWYGDDPRTINIVDSSLKDTDHGSWESNFPNEAKVLLFKALHNTLERHLLSRDYIRVGKWFVNLDGKSTEKNKLFFSFAFCLQGENKICLTVDVKQLPGVRHIVPEDLAKAAVASLGSKVILAPYGIQGYLTGHSYQHNGVGVSKLIEDWKRFFPLHVVDDWTNVPEGIDHDIPVVVGVKVGENFIKCPSHYVLISLEDEDCEDHTATVEANTRSECTSKVSDSKAVACELVNEAWKDITLTKSANKSSGVTTAPTKTFGTNFKADQESFWNLKEPLSRKSCSCTSSSNVSRARAALPNRPFGINRPNPTGGQNTHNTLASKVKKEREKKPILPFHQRAGKIRNINPVSKGLSTCNVATIVADQNRQPNSQVEVKTEKSADNPDGLREKPKPSQPLTNDNVINNNNNIDETFFKPNPPVVTRISEVVRTLDGRKKPSPLKDEVYSKSRKSTLDVWKCYEVFTGDPKLKPSLPNDVLDFRDGEKLPLTTGSVVPMPESAGEVFKIETIENKNFHNKRPPTNDNRAHEDEVPVKRMRRSSSASQSGRNKLETPAAIKPRGHRNSSTSKSQIPAPLPEPTNIAADTHDSVFHPTVPVPRGRANSTSSTGSAASPAPTSSKTSRNTKARRQNRKSQDKKAKEPVVKQEPVKQETEQVLPFLASPPTPRGSISLRTEKDLQVTISDLDNLFDSPDEDEEDSKPRQLSVFTDDHSPPVHHGHDDSNQKSKTTTVSTGPGVVSHADLVRMFPTPPMPDNHPHSPQSTTNISPTPPEVCGQPGQGFIDAVKNINDKINDMLTELKEMPSIFDVPTKQTYLCSSSAIPPVKSLPSSRLPPLKQTEEMVYTPSPPAKSTSSRSDSTSCPATPFSKARTSLSDVFPPDHALGVNSTTQTSKLNALSPKDTGCHPQRPKSSPESDYNCNLLNANLFLSDSYMNYASDTNMDGTNTCLCITGERKYMNRQTIGKEPIGFTRNNDVCQCGLGIFEREKLRQHTGLFSNELLHVSSCMENIGVELDKRYCDTAKRKKISLLVKKEPVTKDSKSAQSAELMGTSNSTILVENLLNQFSSPLSASATSEKLFTGLNNEDSCSSLLVRSASEVEKWSKNTVDFLMDLKPVIQESLHKAIHWKTWDQLSTVQGPLSLKQLCQMNSKGSVSTADSARIPRVIVGHDGDWLSVSPLALHHWEKLLLEPYTSSRDVAYVVLAPENEATNANVKHFFRELSSAYETCQLGRHVPVSRISSMPIDGILKIGPKQQSKYGKNVVSPWFAKFENVPDGSRVKLISQVCKYELGPSLEKLPLEKLALLGDDAGKKNTTDSFCDTEQPRQDTTIVIYMVNPFDECSDQVLRRESYYALLRSFTEMASGLPEKIRSRLVLEIIPLRQITQVDAYQKTKGSLVSFVKLLKTTAFSVFSRCRLTLHKPSCARVHTGFWASSSQRMDKNQPTDKGRTRVYLPAYVLATPTPIVHSTDTVETPEDLATHKESSNLLFCCYGLTQDQRWLLASCTNQTGLIMETFVTSVEPSGLPAKQRRTRQRLRALRRLLEFCQGITSSMIADWRLVIGKLGRFSRHELRDWDEVIRANSSSECTDRCDACSSLRSHARFQSVSVVSLHNELSIRVHLAKVTTAFNNYREPDTTIVESVTRQRISTSFIIINIENSQSTRLAQLDGMHDVDDRAALVDSELMMTEPTTEDDDEIPMIPLFGSIFPSSRMSHLQQELRSSSPHERPSSAPMLTDPVTSSFVPIGLQSPHPSQSACSDEQNEQEKTFGFPLAHGRVYTTAPLGPAFRQYARDGGEDGNSPVVLKAALLLHHVDESCRQGNHVLSSSTHTNVLRYILEQYDALSWLTVGSVCEDRTSCLPVHYITLSQMTRAFTGLLC